MHFVHLKKFILLGLTSYAASEILAGQTVKDILTKRKCLCPCEKEWDATKKYVIPFKEGNWFEAVSYCASQGMSLLQLRDSYDSQNLKQWFDDHEYEAGQNFWIGANDLAKPGLFRWRLTANEVTFSKWARGEPNFITVRGETEHCAELNPNTMEWNDSVCSKRLHFICETFSN
uniref:Putative galactose-specific c-type lectin n=1 Tax=Culex tarsalis TaxID=7177 RepID=A0A1Q3G550_CULTA